MYRQKGFSLIELLCVLVIGLILFSVLFELVINFKATYHIQNALAEMQENARFVSHFLKSNIESAGFAGCRSFNALEGVNVYEGHANQWSPTFPNNFKIKPKPNSDVIEIESGEFVTAKLIQQAKEKDKRIYVSLTPKFKKNKKILLSDCTHHEKFMLKSVSRSVMRNYQVLTFNKEIQNAFYPGAEVTVLHHVIYYLRATSRLSKYNQPIYAIYQKEVGGRSAEVVAGVTGFKINSYEMVQHRLVKKTPSQVQNWQNILFLEVHLSFHAKRKNFKKAYQYQFIIPIRENFFHD